MIRTGWSRLTTGWGTTTSAESAAIEQLISTHRALLLDGGRAEVGSEAGYSACAIFLSAVETTAKTFGLEAAPRAYRKRFSANYRALFPDDARHYRVDVLEASADQHSAIWVNGDKFELSPEAICHAEALQKAWAELSQLVEACAGPDGNTARHPARSDLCTVLEALDAAWAGFEHKYIAELIDIEEQARRLIIKAVELEARLSMLEENVGKGKESQDVQRALVQGIAHLNSVANFRRKGRDDLGYDILESAAAVLSRFSLTSKDIVAAGEGKGFAAAAIQDAVSRSAGVSMAVDVVGSFEAMRRYLREVKKCLERVDPHLCNNVGLVARLVDWEESWEIGSRYVRQTVLFDANNDVAARPLWKCRPPAAEICKRVPGQDPIPDHALPLLLLSCCCYCYPHPASSSVGLSQDLPYLNRKHKLTSSNLANHYHHRHTFLPPTASSPGRRPPLLCKVIMQMLTVSRGLAVSSTLESGHGRKLAMVMPMRC
ncbi:Kcnh5 [Symbiodinium sp. CCMP2592]|nr:Kcnh5 [Symbiodinium sp. CCMP2592]